MFDRQVSRSRRRQAGVTLIELVVVVMIIGVLGSLAVNSYSRYVLRANRADALSTLLQIQVQQEKFLLQNRRYASGTAEVIANAPAGLGITNVDATGNTASGKFNIAVNSPTATTYTATATAINGQVQDTDCPTFSIDETGRKLPDPAANACWR